ncbi:MAG: outer membrane beta-barrel protein [Cyclobacteriaceae bacterium]
MKRISTVLLLILVTAAGAAAQEFNPFKLGVGLGYAMPGGEGAGGGVLFAIEPAYRVNDAIAVGFRMEWAAVIRGLSTSIDSYDASAAAIGSYTVNGNYYFSNGNFRPYVGAGVGLFTLAAAAVEASGTGGSAGAAAESKIGFYPRVGFDAGHFNISIDYNIIGKTTFEGSDLEMKNSYIGIRIGGFFFGGRK